MSGAPLKAAAAGAGLLLTAVAWIATPTNELLHYDQYYALIWGRELFGGDLPSYETARGSTPHPLTVFVTALLAPAGDDTARELFGVLNLLAWAVIVVACGVIGHRLLGAAAGLAGAVVVALNPQLFDLIGAGSADAFFAALLVAAVAVEVHRPRAGAPVLVLLAVAGLTRPEAWLFAGAYWLWLLPGSTMAERARRTGLVAAGPAIWLATDALVTGDPLFSLTRTQHGARNFRPTGIGEIVPQLRAGLRLLLDVPDVLGAAVCVALLWARRAGRAAVPAAVVILSVVGFAALGVADLPMLPRYLLVATALVSAAAGWSLGGWLALEGRRMRLAAAGAALLVLVAFASRAPGRIDTFGALFDDQRYRNARLADLRVVLERVQPPRCEVWSSFEFKSAVAYEMDVAPDTVRVLLDEGPVEGLVLVPADERGQASYRLPVGFMQAAAGSVVVAMTPHWRVLDVGCRPDAR